MDKYEFNIKVEQIKKLINKSDYETAMKIADSIDWRRVRNANLLSMVAEVYEKNEEYQEAKDILLIAFERAPIGKRLLFKLTELALKEGNVEEAEAYYREFCDLAPDDSRQHLLRYLILKIKNAPVVQLIHSLESFTTEELDEKWLYELATLYHEAGNGEQCVIICDRIMLMFGLGKYVDKAMELKLQHAPLTKYQMDLVENRDKYEAKLREVQQDYQAAPEAEESYDEDDAEDGQIQIIDEELQPAGQYMEERSIGELMDESEDEYNFEMDPLPGTMIEVSTDAIDGQELVVAVEQAEVEERLAEQMSKISFEDYPDDDDVPGGQTRILGDLKSIKMVSTDMDGQADRAIDDVRVAEPVRTPQPAKAPEIIRIPAARKRPEQAVSRRLKGAYLMITSRTPEKGLELAVETLKALQLSSEIKNPVAKISGSKLNKKGMLASVEKLAGKDLIIEEAGDLDPGTVDELETILTQSNGRMRILMVDNPKQIQKMREKYPTLLQWFEMAGADFDDPQTDSAEEEPPVTIAASETVSADGRPIRRVKPAREEYQMPYKKTAPEPQLVEEPAAQPDPEPEPEDEEEMDIDEFAQYACKYAGEIDCSITGKSMLALYERIEIMEEDGITLTRSSAEELIEEAADRAEKPSLGKLITGVFSSKYDKDGLLILKEEHFI